MVDITLRIELQLNDKCGRRKKNTEITLKPQNSTFT